MEVSIEALGSRVKRSSCVRLSGEARMWMPVNGATTSDMEDTLLVLIAIGTEGYRMALVMS